MILLWLYLLFFSISLICLGIALLIDRSSSSCIEKESPTFLFTITSMLFVALYLLLMLETTTNIRLPTYTILYTLLYCYGSITLGHYIFNVISITITIFIGTLVLSIPLLDNIENEYGPVFGILISSLFFFASAIHRSLCYCYNTTWYSFWVRLNYIVTLILYIIIWSLSKHGFKIIEDVETEEYFFILHDVLFLVINPIHLLCYPYEVYIENYYRKNKMRFDGIISIDNNTNNNDKLMHQFNYY